MKGSVASQLSVQEAEELLKEVGYRAPKTTLYNWRTRGLIEAVDIEGKTIIDGVSFSRRLADARGPNAKPRQTNNIHQITSEAIAINLSQGTRAFYLQVARKADKSLAEVIAQFLENEVEGLVEAKVETLRQEAIHQAASDFLAALT